LCDLNTPQLDAALGLSVRFSEVERLRLIAVRGETEEITEGVEWERC